MLDQPARDDRISFPEPESEPVEDPGARQALNNVFPAISRPAPEDDAGAGIGFSDADYLAAGAQIADQPEALFDAVELMVKVKEPQREEWTRLRAEHTLFTYLHLAPDPDPTADLLAGGATCVAYETMSDAHGGLPLLAPMSEVAGGGGQAPGIQVGAGCDGLLIWLELCQDPVASAMPGVPYGADKVC